MTRQVTRTTHASRFRAPSIPIESTASTWAGMATRDCYLATSVDQPGDAVVHQVRSRGRKAPAKRQVESSAAQKTHGASTGLALRLMRAKRTRSEHRQIDANDRSGRMTPDYEYGRREFESLRARHQHQNPYFLGITR